MKKKTRLENLQDILPPGMFVDDYSPGDGITRYRFSKDNTGYFACRGVYTALGMKEAETFARGALEGYYLVKESAE